MVIAKTYFWVMRKIPSKGTMLAHLYSTCVTVDVDWYYE